MADRVEPQDVVSVGTRISWSAILAGAFIAMALSISLGILGVALGLSLTDNVEGDSLAVGTAIYALLTMIASLFLGGYVASLATAGETKGEAMIYGVLVWSLLFIIFPVVTVGLGAQYGFGVVMGQANLTRTGQPTPDASEMLREAGVSEEQIEKYRSLQEEGRQQVRQVNPASAAWWAFAGIVISLFAAIIGAIVGAGPELVFGAIYRRTTVVRRD